MLRVVQEGRSPKFLAAVEQITFNGALAAALGRRVLYVTERCVFQLTPEGLRAGRGGAGITPNGTFCR